jgi:hypothetical protein
MLHCQHPESLVMEVNKVPEDLGVMEVVQGLAAAAGQVEGVASYVVGGGPARASVTLMSDNANWWII